MTDEEKYKRLYRCVNKWLQCIQEEKYLSAFLKHKSISSVGIYGYGALGKNAMRELKRHQFPVFWIADQKEIDVGGVCPFYSADQIGEAKQPDMIIITSVTDIEEIEKKLQMSFRCHIITIEELVDCVLERGNDY